VRLEEAGVVDGVSGVGGERVEKLQIGLAEHAARARRDLLLGEVDDADDPLRDAERHADERFPAVARVVDLAEAGILLDVLDHDRLAHLHDLAGDALAHLDLDRSAAGFRQPAPDRHAQGLAVAIQEHDRSDARAHRAHGALEDVGQQVFDPRDAGGHLDHVVERAELEHEVLETLGRRPQLDEHTPERLGDLTDLVHLAQAGHRRRRGRFRRGSERAGRGLVAGSRDRQGLSEGASEIGDALGETSEEDEAEEGDREGAEDTDLGFGRSEQLEPPHEVHEDQQGQDGGQREDGAGGFAELH